MTEASANFPMALDEADHRLFIGCRRPAKLLVLDTETGKTVAALEIGGEPTISSTTRPTSESTSPVAKAASL